MGDKLKIDYNLLNDANRDLLGLADGIDPTLNEGVFSRLVDGDSTSMLGSSDMASAVVDLHSNAKYTMSKADKGLRELADAFGSVGQAFLQFDAELSANVNVMNSNLALSNYNRDKELWDYYQEHQSECQGSGEKPDFCSATNPGDHPPTDQTITTDRGDINTHLTLDDEGNVIKEETTINYDDKKYTTVTQYLDGDNHIVTDTTYTDGSTAHTEIQMDGHGGGTMKTTESDGSWSEYTKSNNGEWVETEASQAANAEDADDDEYTQNEQLQDAADDTSWQSGSPV